MRSQDRSTRRRHVAGKERGRVPEPDRRVAAAGGTAPLDLQEIFTPVGEVPYVWQIDSDALQWGRNVGEVLAISDPAAIASGLAFAQLIDPDSSGTRADALTRAGSRDDGSGVSYQLQYALRLPGDS